MNRRQPRVGIERKILTSILWVGILPMTVAMIVGYITARRGQSSATQQTLQTEARKTVEGLQRDTSSRLRVASGLAADPQIVEYVGAGEPGGPGAEIIMDWLRRQSALGEDGPTLMSLYDREGALMLSTDRSAAAESLNPVYPRDTEEPVYCDFTGAGTQFMGTMVAPIRTSEREIVGHLIVTSGVSSLLQYTLGESALSVDAETRNDNYQISVVAPDNTVFTVRLGRLPGTDQPVLTPSPPNETLVGLLTDRPSAGSLQVEGYQIDARIPPQAVLLAYQRMTNLSFVDFDVYFVAYRPTAEVFSTINSVASVALLGCILFIAVLCVNAYRDVHSNIVRPISLLNEGAQIIRQGDFDLKLKIDTGDEIEELASSFNKMAMALSRNVQKLEASEEKYRNLVTTMRDGVYQTDPDGVLTFLNPTGVDILGFQNLEDALGTNIHHMFADAEDFDRDSDAPDVGDAGERPRFWIRRWDDRTICVEMTRARTYDESGTQEGVEGIIRDVTKSVALEEAAKERSERISAINQIANVINSSLEAGRLYESLVAELKKLVEFDYASVALLSDSGVEFEGRQLWPEDDGDAGYTFTLDGQHSYAAWVARERRCLLIGDLHDAPSPFTSQFPENIASCLCVPLYATGRIIGTLNLGSRTVGNFTTPHVETLEEMAPHLAVAIRNAQLLVNLQLSLEEVTRAREKLFQANDELKTLDELKTNLLSNVSHELRTPLVSVMGYTDMILNGKAGPINKTQQDYLEISLRNVEKLVTLIENLLDFSRLHRGDERIFFDTFDLAECARTSAQIVQPIADTRGITIDIQETPEPILVEGDKSKLGQVFNNLLSNAVKFNKNNGNIAIDFKPLNDEVEVIVTDTGIGIPSDALDKIFTRFYQYDGSSTRKYGGTGIGLAIAQDIVRLHGSSIMATSTPGDGSTFRFSLRCSSKNSAPQTIPELPIPDETQILVELMSRDRSLIIQVRNFLTTENMDLMHASNADRAVELMERHSPDCVLIDVDDPELDRTALDDVLNHPLAREVPVVLVTNLDQLYEQVQGLVSARIRRSFRKSVLLSGIHNALSKGIFTAESVGEKILCVDDDPEILTFVTRCLEAEGYATEHCKSGEEAMEQLARDSFGLVLLDVAMPGMDGWETCRKIKDDPAFAGIKVYMVTAKPVERNMSKMTESGADGFLLKPFRPEDLAQLVHGLELRAVAK